MGRLEGAVCVAQLCATTWDRGCCFQQDVGPVTWLPLWAEHMSAGIGVKKT